MKRRTWLLSAAGAAGALIVGWGVMPPRSRLGAADLLHPAQGEVALNGWIKVAADGRVVVAMPRSEMGQGVHTGLAMLVAEELDLRLDQVRLEQAGPDAIYGNVAMLVSGLPFHPLESQGPDGKELRSTKVVVGEWLMAKLARELGINATGGSSSITDGWEVMRTAAAAARATLLAAAAMQWKVPVSEIRVVDGLVSHPSGRQAGYGELARLAGMSSPGPVVLKDPKDWKLIGRPQPRLDIPGKVDGSARFGLDVRRPNMLYAAVRHAPMLGGEVGRVDLAQATKLPGVEKALLLPSYAGSTAGLAVVGKTWWHASQAAKSIEVEWKAPLNGAPDSAVIAKQLDAAVDAEQGFTFYSKGSAADAEAAAHHRVTARYRAPYLAHATMEPMNCTAQVTPGKVEIWAPTQVPVMARDLAARVAGVPKEQVVVHVTLLGGGFGRRLEVDFVGQAVRVAMECQGKPVQLIWSREEDMTHDFYRPMHAAQLTAALDASGAGTSLRIKSAGDAITPRWLGRGVPSLSGPVDTPDKTTAEGLFDLPYGFEHQHMEHVATRNSVPVGFWRSVGHSHNAFFSESFVDELAAHTKTDPVAFRLALLKNAPRYRAVLELAAAKSGWGTSLPVGRARGVALHESFGSIVAQVAEVSLVGGKIRVHQVTCAVDCGVVVNPASVSQQMESAVVYGLSAALYGRIDVQAGVVQQNNFLTYAALGLADAPLVSTWVVPSERQPGGMGEPGVPPVAPAVANALFSLTGTRQRALPLMA